MLICPVYLNEFKPKERKQKESKVEQIGEVAFDCLELVQGKISDQ